MDSVRFKNELIPCSPELYRCAYRMLGNEEDARDMVQELFVKLWNMRSRLDSLASPKAFATATLRNMCIDKMRSDSKWDQRVGTERLAAEADEGPPGAEEEQFMRISAAMDTLPEKQRKVFMLKYIKGCKVSGISAITGLGQTNIRVLLLRARNNIKTRLKEYEDN